MGFDLSLLDIFTAIAGGAALIPFASKGDKLMPARLISSCGITLWHSSPSAFELFDHSGQLTSATLMFLRVVVFCGEQLFPTLIEKIFKARENMLIYNNYGPTEATIFCSYQRLTSDNFRDFSSGTMSIGGSLPSTDITLEVIEDGVGELVVRGNCVGKGYLASDGQGGYLSKAGSKRPFAFRTGDFCRWDGGKLYFVCRKDRQVKISGNRVDLSEIDLMLRVEGCEAAVSCFDGRAIRSFVLAQGKTAEQLRSTLSLQLPLYYVPAMIYVLQSFPYTQSGKVDTDALIRWEIDNGHA
jgi:D-alanine--poly(phosphoribitol) ligase subunit 1